MLVCFCERYDNRDGQGLLGVLLVIERLKSIEGY